MAKDEALITAKVTRTASEISSFSLIRIRSWGSLCLVSGDSLVGGAEWKEEADEHMWLGHSPAHDFRWLPWHPKTLLRPFPVKSLLNTGKHAILKSSPTLCTHSAHIIPSAWKFLACCWLRPDTSFSRRTSQVPSSYSECHTQAIIMHWILVL